MDRRIPNIPEPDELVAQTFKAKSGYRRVHWEVFSQIVFLIFGFGSMFWAFQLVNTNSVGAGILGILGAVNIARLYGAR